MVGPFHTQLFNFFFFFEMFAPLLCRRLSDRRSTQSSDVSVVTDVGVVTWTMGFMAKPSSSSSLFKLLSSSSSVLFCSMAACSMDVEPSLVWDWFPRNNQVNVNHQHTLDRPLVNLGRSFVLTQRLSALISSVKVSKRGQGRRQLSQI